MSKYINNFFYYLIDKKIQIIIGIFLILFSFSVSLSHAETNIIYDNYSVSQYKFINLNDFNDIIPLMNDYKYKVLIDGKFNGYYSKDDNIFYPDYSNITIILPSPIKTNTDNLWEKTIKPMAFTSIGFIITWGILLILLILLIGYILYRVYRKIIRGY